jgi:hypothetical protein
MQISKRAAVAMLAVSALAGSATTAVSAVADKGGGGPANGDNRGDHHGRGDHRDRRDHDPFRDHRVNSSSVLRTTLAPSVPTDPVLHGAAAGGAPWVLKFGDARVRFDGRVDVRIRGLVIPVAPGNGTPGPVTMVSASVYCGADTTAVGTTASVPISTAGDASIRGQFTLPAKCLAPTLLIHPNGANTTYIAASGFGG